MNQTRFWILLLVAFCLAGVAVRAQSPVAGAENYLGGSPAAPITIEVFSDFECPACRELFLDTMRPVLANYCPLDKVSVIYHEFPLPGHKHSRVAARYSMAAQRLGREQWLAVVEALYMNQAQWSVDGNIEAVVAKVLSLEDLLQVKKHLEDPSINETIERDIALGNKREVKSTPTFFVTAVNREQKVVGGLPYTVLKQFFDKIVK